ncbi:MAG: PilZ domain-containing protein [Methylohalobius sp.]|nr:PilZ domain-containing protein [Methylohalobius sp.]
MSEIQSPAHLERRRYFRIEDEIVLTYRPIAAEDMPASEQLTSRLVDQFSVTAALEYLGQESQVQLRRIQRDSPEVAKYLELLERKIELLAQAFMIHHNRLLHQPTCQVNLSASGIAFNTEQALTEGQILELKMVIPPALVGILTFGKVIYCRPQGESDYRAGVDFLDLRAQDREFLIRHVVKRQLSLLREQKRSPP